MIRSASFLLIFFIVLGSGCKSDSPTSQSIVDNTKDVANEPKVIKEETKVPVVSIEEPKAEPKEDLEPKLAAAKPKPIEQKVAPNPKPKPRPKPQAIDSKPKPKPKPKPVATAATAPSTSARVYFHKTVHEFGEIDEGDKITATFKFTNTGKAPLTIDNVDVSCGCTMPSYPIMPIGPGENGEIGVVYNSKGKFGTQKPTLTVKTNATQPITKLYLSGSIKHVFEKVRTDSVAVESDSTSIGG